MAHKLQYFNKDVETKERGDLDALVDEYIHYTVKYAAEFSPFYRKWFKTHGIKPQDIRSHEDLLELPIISGRTIREHQPPETPDFLFKSTGWENVYTIHETSGTSGTPKSFFLTQDDWQQHAEKYARIFISQGFGPGDKVVVCASYGMNVGASMMTAAAREIGMTIIPEGKCTFPVRVMRSYRPTAVVGSVFKLLHLARRMSREGLDPRESGVERLVVGGESFAEESRTHLAEIWGCDVYNTYGSTEGTMCGECTELSGLHVPEDMVHMDIYDPHMQDFVPDGECGRIVLTSLLAPGSKCGSLLLNYDTDDTTVVITRDRCRCGRTHMKITNPQREAETVWIQGSPFNRVDVERGVFQPDNMKYLTGEYEAFLYGGDDEGETVLRVSVENYDIDKSSHRLVEENFIKAFFQFKPELNRLHVDEVFKIILNFVGPGELELYRVKGRPKRLVDRR